MATFLAPAYRLDGERQRHFRFKSRSIAVIFSTGSKSSISAGRLAATAYYSLPAADLRVRNRDSDAAATLRGCSACGEHAPALAAPSRSMLPPYAPAPSRSARRLRQMRAYRRSSSLELASAINSSTSTSALATTCPAAAPEARGTVRALRHAAWPGATKKHFEVNSGTVIVGRGFRRLVIILSIKYSRRDIKGGSACELARNRPARLRQLAVARGI